MKNQAKTNGTMTRRKFFEKSLALAGGIASASFIYPTVIKADAYEDYEMYTESDTWSNDDATWWEGRRVGGVPIGVIQLSANIPMLPGNMGNASTFDFPLIYEPMEVTGDMVVSSKPHPEVLKRSIEAGKKLEKQGVRAIVGNCGFFANYQPQVSAELNVPFFSSSLLQIPIMLMSLRPDEKVGIITADGPKLEAAPALEYCGVTDRSRVVIAGAEKKSQMKQILNTTGAYNPRKFEQELIEVAVEMIKKDEKIKMILLECTELPPHARAIQQATGMPVWGFPSMVDWIYSGIVRRNFIGYV